MVIWEEQPRAQIDFGATSPMARNIYTARDQVSVPGPITGDQMASQTAIVFHQDGDLLALHHLARANGLFGPLRWLLHLVVANE